MSIRQIVVLLILTCSCFSCSVEATRNRLPSPIVNTIVLRPIEAVVNAPHGEVIYTKRSEGPSDADLIEHVQFVNKNCGWVSTAQSLYRTSDGGGSWEKMSVNVAEYSHISSFFFIDDSFGWLVITKQIFTERYGLGNSSRILNSKDGGSTWTEQASLADEIKINEIAFQNPNDGFAVGARIIDQPVSVGPPYEESFVLATKDGGKVWGDISQSFNNAFKDEHGNTSDSGWGIGWLSSDKCHVLTRNGRIVTTSDQGKTWATTVKLKEERPHGEISSTGYHKLVLDPDQNIRVIGGAMGDEGYWGDLIVNEKDNRWNSYELRLIPLFDVVYLSSNEVLATGIAMGPKNITGSTHSVGVILHSTDAGKSWKPIYRSKAKEAFISITQIGAREFYAVSDVGTLLAFTL